MKVRDAATCLLVLASLTGTAAADLAPQDPYPDAAPAASASASESATVEVDAISGVGAVPKPVEPKAAPVAAVVAAEPEAETLDEAGAWWEDREVQVGAGIGFGLFVLVLAIRGRRRARRREIELANRRTQFGMSAIDPAIAAHNVAAWERHGMIMPSAIHPEMLRAVEQVPVVQPVPSLQPRPPHAMPPHAPPHAMPPHVMLPHAMPPHAMPPYAMQPQPMPQPMAAMHAQPFAPSPQPAPADAPPYQGYSTADLAAYGMGTPAAPAPMMPPVAARAVMVPVLPTPIHDAQPVQPLVQPLVMPPVVQERSSLRKCHVPWARPAPQASVSPPSFAPVPRPHPGLAQTVHPFAASGGTSSQPAVALLQPASLAPHTPSPRRMRLAEGTPQPPIANPQFGGLPAMPPPSHVGAPSYVSDSDSTKHFARHLDPSSTEGAPAAYPLTFPAYPDAAGSTLAAIEPSGLNRYWGPPSKTDVDVCPNFPGPRFGAPGPQFARGSQPVEQLDAYRRPLPADAETRIAPMPADAETRIAPMPPSRRQPC